MSSRTPHQPADISGSTGRRKRPKVRDCQRKRVKGACHRCRKDKLRCNGATPCERCAGTGKPCHYGADEQHGSGADLNSASPRAGGQGELSISRDEWLAILWSIVSETHPELSGNLDSLRYYKLCNHDTQSSPATVLPSRQKTRSFTYGGDTESPSASMTVVNQGKTHFEGTTSLWSFFSSVRQAVTDNAPHEREDDDNGEAHCGGDTVHYTSNLSGFGVDWKTAVLDALPPRHVVDFLTRTYFRFVQANYVCVHPEMFSRKLITGTGEARTCQYARAS